MTNEELMNEALKEAKLAYKKKEVPVGAIITYGNKIVSRGHNSRLKDKLIDSHAEIIAINKLCKRLRHRNLSGYSMYVTLEPCPMCAYAIMEAHISNIYIGAYDNKRGAISTLDIFNKGLGSKVNVYDIINNEGSELIKTFFKEKR